MAMYTREYLISQPCGFRLSVHTCLSHSLFRILFFLMESNNDVISMCLIFYFSAGASVAMEGL